MYAVRCFKLAAPALAMTILAVACGPTRAAPPVTVDHPPTPTGSITLRVLHTNDLWGATNPCG